MNTPVIFVNGNVESIPALAGELWTKIDERCLKNVRPWYYVSTFGRVYSSRSGRILNPTIAPVGYYVVTLRTTTNKGITCFVHRLVMMSFCYIPGCEELQVNHLNCNTLDNYICNLEWVTIAENVHHALQNGLLLTGERAPWTKISTEQVERICELYLSGHDVSDIHNMTGYSLGSLYDILQGRTRKEETQKYNIKFRYKR